VSSPLSAAPYKTGRRRAIEQIIRTTAPMHDGFAGGAFHRSHGRALGITTASTIRGLGVIIPAGIAWKTAKDLLEHGGLKTRLHRHCRGKPVRLPEAQRVGQVEEGLACRRGQP
jgi:S1-C subfamily serine protease